MNCPDCFEPLLSCHCFDADTKIEAFLASSEGRKMNIPTRNRLIWRAADIIERRLEVNQFRPKR